MARARNLKPGFFKNENLAECSPWARLCFAGLWTLADRDGRLEDRPKRIKGELFAFDTVDVEPLLLELAREGFILRYRNQAGLAIIQVLKFWKHQNPHHKEPKGALPSPQSLGLLVDGMDEEPEALGSSDEPTTQGEPEALSSRVVIPSTRNRAESKPLIPESGDTPPVGGRAQPVAGPPAEGDELPGMPSADLAACPHRRLIAQYAAKLPELPQPRAELWEGSAGATAMRQRWRWLMTTRREDGSRYAETTDEGVEWFGRFFQTVADSAFLSGRSGRWTKCNLAWLMQREKFSNVIEGQYADDRSAG